MRGDGIARVRRVQHRFATSKTAQNTPAAGLYPHSQHHATNIDCPYPTRGVSDPRTRFSGRLYAPRYALHLASRARPNVNHRQRSAPRHSLSTRTHYRVRRYQPVVMTAVR